MTAETVAARSDPPSLPITYTLVWTFIFLVLMVMVMGFGGFRPSRAIGPALSIVLPNAILGLFSLRLAHWWPLLESRTSAFAIRHALALAAYAAVSLGLWQLVRVIEATVLGRPLGAADASLIFWICVTYGLTHTVMAAIGYVRKAAFDIRAERARAAESERLCSKAELALLRTQLNPHFLLNTLHAVMGLVRRDPDLAERAIETLGDLVKTGQRLQVGGDAVALRQEWHFVGRYLELEKLRFGDRLRISLTTNDDVLEALVPPFSLLPLVENAVIHGVGALANGGVVRVGCERGPTQLVLRVEDSGAGATAEVIRQSPRLGLRLLRERLAHLYGERARLDFGPGSDGLFRAQITLPIETVHAD